MANGDSMPQPAPWQQRHERELVEQRGREEANARLNRALRYWFRRDTWTPDEALPLLIGIDPGSLTHGDSHIRYLDGALVCIAASMHAHGVEWPIESFDDFGTLEDLKAVPSLLHEMKLMWESGNHPPRNAPSYFIEWARRKGFNVPWLEPARDLGLIEDAEGATPPDTLQEDAPNMAGLTKRERQIQAIEAITDELHFARMNIPDGGKQQIKIACKATRADLFGAGDDPFKAAWQEAVNQERIRMANHEKYARFDR
ncbi:hypothetical protein [Burkholderia sp. Tr-20390]|uniref:hypothetical protein n=1 Tax=Burkholderia sp. Tr-20390 TaxID=2703904 RepID=UPI00197EEBA5|nr:hypothetical protein [Burkholderia sp. Tr-20390]MBN3730903.1 hypothetical protein [Burkholderia sp. Tr-20390]